MGEGAVVKTCTCILSALVFKLVGQIWFLNWILRETICDRRGGGPILPCVRAVRACSEVGQTEIVDRGERRRKRVSLNENPRVDRPGGLRLAHCDVLHHPLDGLDGGAPHLRSHLRGPFPFSALQCQSLSDFVYVQWWYNFRFRLPHLPFKSLKFGHNFSQVGIQSSRRPKKKFVRFNF